MIVATDVIEHIQDDVAALQKIVRLCKPEGKIVLTVPALQWLFGYHDEVLGHHRRYSMSSLRNLVDPVFEIQYLRYFGMFLIPIALLISRLLRRPYPVSHAGSTAKTNGVIDPILQSLFNLEKILPLPLGTSLLLVGKARNR